MSSNKGWVMLHRKIMEHPFYRERRKFSKNEAWIDILLNVNHTPSELTIGMEIFKCERGQSLFSIPTWADRWKWDVSKVKRFFILLRDLNMIVTENLQKTTRLTVCNYDSYQGERTADELSMNCERTADELSMTTNNNNNKVNNENNIKVGDDKPLKKSRKKAESITNDPILFPFNSPFFLNAWQSWKDYKKKEYSFSYKSSQSEQIALKDLSDKSKGSEATALLIIQQSIANGWKGLFELKKDAFSKSSVQKSVHVASKANPTKASDYL